MVRCGGGGGGGRRPRAGWRRLYISVQAVANHNNHDSPLFPRYSLPSPDNGSAALLLLPDAHLPTSPCPTTPTPAHTSSSSPQPHPYASTAAEVSARPAMLSPPPGPAPSTLSGPGGRTGHGPGSPTLVPPTRRATPRSALEALRWSGPYCGDSTP